MSDETHTYTDKHIHTGINFKKLSFCLPKVGFKHDFNPPTSLNMMKLKEQKGKTTQNEVHPIENIWIRLHLE